MSARVIARLLMWIERRCYWGKDDTSEETVVLNDEAVVHL